MKVLFYTREYPPWSGLSDLASCGLMVKEWIALGADIIGGCYGIGPEQIKAMGKIISQPLSTSLVLG